jgi:4-hydroxybenzoate polyprenyltransferase
MTFSTTMHTLIAFAKLLRLPGIGALGIPTVIAALVVGTTAPVNLTLVFIIGAIASIFGFLMNDYVDIELDGLVDELKKKPLVSGAISRKTALITAIFLIFIAFLLVSILYYGQTLDYYKFMAIMSLIAAGFLGTIYDLYGKRFVGSDILVAISVAFIFLFGALSFSAPNVIIWIIFILTFNNLLYMNAIQNGIKDADHDHKMGVKNIALLTGVKVAGYRLTIPPIFQMFGMGIRLTSAILLFTPFIFFNYPYYLWQMALLAIGSMVMLFISTRLLSMKTHNRGKIRKIIGVQSFLRYSLVPIMLISIIGITNAIIILIIPILWYIIFTPFMGEKIFKPRM